MTFRLLTIEDNEQLISLADHYLNFYYSNPKEYTDFESVEKEANFLKEHALLDTNKVISSGEFDNGHLISLGIGISFDFWSDRTFFSDAWYWRFLYTKNKRFRISAPFIDCIAEPILTKFENLNKFRFFKTTKLPKRLLLDDKFIHNEYNKIINFKTYDSKIKYICNAPHDVKMIEYPFNLFFMNKWKHGVSYVLMEHTKKKE